MSLGCETDSMSESRPNAGEASWGGSDVFAPDDRGAVEFDSDVPESEMPEAEASDGASGEESEKGEEAT